MKKESAKYYPLIPVFAAYLVLFLIGRNLPGMWQLVAMLLFYCALGQAFNQALGEKRGILRMADASVPMDEALALVAVDISGRGYAVLDLSFHNNDMFGFPSDLVRHFLESFAIEARLNLHARILYGDNDHHRAEALFKALGRALDMAAGIDVRISGELPSTKGFLET